MVTFAIGECILIVIHHFYIEKGIKHHKFYQNENVSVKKIQLERSGRIYIKHLFCVVLKLPKLKLKTQHEQC